MCVCQVYVRVLRHYSFLVSFEAYVHAGVFGKNGVKVVEKGDDLLCRLRMRRQWTSAVSSNSWMCYTETPGTVYGCPLLTGANSVTALPLLM